MNADRNIPNRKLGWMLLLLAAPGCVFVPLEKAAKQPARPATPTEVKLGGNGLNLGETAAAQCTPNDFVRKLNELLAARRLVSATVWVERYPDVALETLRQTTAAQSAEPARQYIAEVHDRQCGSTWLEILRDRAAYPARYAAHDALRQQSVDLIKTGRYKEAAALRITDLPKGVPGKSLALDAWQTHGVALLLDSRPGEAEAAFSYAIKQAESGSADQVTHLLLLQSEALRRAGKVEQANASWREAVAQASNGCRQQSPIVDPIFWERASYLRPVDVAWPATVAEAVASPTAAAQRLLHDAIRCETVSAEFKPLALLGPDGAQPALARADSAGAANNEALVWEGIGRQRLVRGEAQAALVAFKRAEGMTTDAGLQAELQLGEAKALLGLNLQAPALAVLVRLTAQPDGPTTRTALALMGTAKFQTGSVEQGRQLLERSLATESDWPGRPEAEADLGLVYLTLGNEEVGLRWLHGAQQRFATAHDLVLLRQSLLNEMTYCTHKNRREEADAIRRRLEAVETGGEFVAAAGMGR